MKVRGLSSIIMVFVLVTILLGCSPTVSQEPETAGLNFIIAADGQVSLKRKGWIEFHPTSFGAELRRGDQVKPEAGTNVIVLCDNLTTWTVPGGTASGLSNGCPQGSEPVLVSGKSRIANTRGGIDPFIPYIISPRATKILDPLPTLRWNSVSGATTYTVRISGTDWQAETDNTEFKYPGDPVLQPGVDYLLIVEANNGKSSREEDQPGLRFNLLGGEEADRVRANVNRIQSLGLSGQAEAFALAQLYAGYELYAEAVDLLQESAGLNPQAANVYLALGKLYQQLGLLKEADTAYREAVRIADSVGDLEGAAAARAGLGQVYLALGNKDIARNWLTQAQTGYTGLGDSQRASQIAAELAELNK